MKLSVDVIIPTLGLRKDGLNRMLDSVQKHSPGTRCIVADESGPRNYAYIIRDLIKRSKADIVVWGGDSCEWTSDVAGIVKETFIRHFPDTDGCVGLNVTNLPKIDGVTEYCFMAIGRKFWQRFPDDLCMCPYYHHFWTDTELGRFADKLGKFKWAEKATVYHPLPGFGLDETDADETHEAGRLAEREDHALWRDRSTAGVLWGQSFGNPQHVTLRRKKRLAKISNEAAKWSIFQNDPCADAALFGFLDKWFPNRYDLNILEIGTCRGVSAALLSERGHVTTLDVCAYNETQRVIDAFGMGRRVTRIVGPPAQARALVSGRQWDMVFIDGMHEYAPVKTDWEFARTLSKRFLFHDYCKLHPGVVKLVDEVKASIKADWECRDTFAAATML